jgi:transposase InsO family protein
VRTTPPDGQARDTINLPKCDFTADRPNRKWLVDITALSTDEGCLYLAGVLDLFSRRLPGSVQRECLDHLLIFGEHHLHTVIRAYVAYYTNKRPCQGQWISKVL